MKYFLFFLVVFFSPYSYAADNFGLAMHGAAKYTPEDAHLSYANPDAPKGGSITQGIIGTFDNLNPFSIKGKAAEGLNLYYDRLMARVWDEPFTMYPLIAQSYDIADNRSWISFTLNPLAKFNDGSPITIDDIIFSFETLKISGRPNMRQVYKLVKRAEKTGERSVKFTFGEGANRETPMILAMMPVLSKKYWQGKTFDATTLDIPVSSGPYKIAIVDPGRSITYVRDPNYWARDFLTAKGHFNFDKIKYEYYRDDTIAFEAFKAGNISLRLENDAAKWTSNYDFPAVKSGAVIKDKMKHGRPERVRAMIYNTRRTPFDDIRVRKALELLFDFNWANKNLFYNEYKRIDSYFPNSELAAHTYSAPSADLRKNMRDADALLKEAGWIVENGKRTKNGPFTFEMILDTNLDEKLALQFKKSLERMGITMNLRILDSANFRARVNEYDYDMVLHYWISSLSPGTEQPLYWGCKAAKEQARWNFPGICTPEIDALANVIAATKSRDELVSSVKKLDKALIDGHYMIPLYYYGYDNYAYWKPVARPAAIPVYGPVLETWWMDQPKPKNPN